MQTKRKEFKTRIYCRINIDSDRVKKLEHPSQMLSVIEKADAKRLPKHSIIAFLKNKGISSSNIVQSYITYYKEQGLYEMNFNERPLGFCVIKGNKGKNAIISTIEHDINIKKGMQIGSRIYAINGKRVDDTDYHEIIKQISQQQTPFDVTFKEYQESDSVDISRSISCFDYSWDCSPFLETNESATMQLSPSISPLIGSDVYVSPTDDDSDDLEDFELNRAFTFGDRDIRRALKKDSKVHSDTTQILLLGSHNSGKSTIMKQLRRIYGNEYTDKERIKFIMDIHKFIIKQMKLLLNILDGMPFVVNCGSHNKYGLSTKALKAKEYLDNLNVDNICLDNKICSAIKYLWNQASIIDLYKKCKSDRNISCNAPYFWNDMDRINNRHYIPSTNDILMVPSNTTRIVEQKYTLNRSNFNVINICGQRSDWKKWIECFSNVDVVVFVASLECYDSELENHAELVMNWYIECIDIPDDITNIILKYCIELGVASKNAMNEQLLFFEKICNHKALENTQIVLCLNKFDLFYKKIIKKAITVCPPFERYYGSAHSVDSSVEYIRDSFLCLDRKNRYIDCWFMDCMDYKSIRRNFDERIIKLMKPSAFTVKIID